MKALESLTFSNNINESKQKYIVLNKQLTTLIKDKGDGIMKTDNSIKVNDLSYSTTKKSFFKRYTWKEFYLNVTDQERNIKLSKIKNKTCDFFKWERKSS